MGKQDCTNYSALEKIDIVTIAKLFRHIEELKFLQNYSYNNE